MATIREYFEEKLQSMGMFENQAKGVMDSVVSTQGSVMIGRWSDDVNDYPPVMTNILWLEVEVAALDYIDTNCPQAWFRPMFDRADPIHSSGLNN